MSRYSGLSTPLAHRTFSHLDRPPRGLPQDIHRTVFAQLGNTMPYLVSHHVFILDLDYGTMQCEIKPHMGQEKRDIDGKRKADRWAGGP